MTIVEYAHTKLVVCLIVLAALVGPSKAFAQGSDGSETNTDGADGPVSPDARFAHLTDELGEMDSPAGELSSLYRLNALERYLPVEQYRSLLEEAEGDVESPMTRFAIRRRLYRDSLNREFELSSEPGQIEPMLMNMRTEHWDANGCLVDWKMVGPFDNDSMDGFEARLGPERGKSGPYDGKRRQIRWREFPGFVRGCHMRVGRAMASSSSSVAFLARTLEVNSPGARRLLVGAAGAYRIWLNGTLVAARDEDRGFSVDSQAWKVNVKAGENRLLVKLASSRTGSMSLMTRLVGADLTNQGLSPDAAQTLLQGDGPPQLEPVEAGATPNPTGEGRVARMEACATDDSVSTDRRVDCLVSWSRLEALHPASPWMDPADGLVESVRSKNSGVGDDADEVASANDIGVREGRQDTDPGGSSSASVTEDGSELTGRALVRLADIYDNVDERLEVYRLAHQRSPGDPVVALELARAESQSLQETSEYRRRNRVEALRRRYPDLWTAQLELANWHAFHGYGGRALKMLEQIEVDQKLGRPALLSRLATLTAQYGERGRAEGLSKKMAAIRRLETGWIRQQVNEALAEGDQAAAKAWTGQQLDLFPWSVGWRLRMVDISRTWTGLSAALANVEVLLDLIPGLVRAHRRKAELLVEMNRREQATSVLKAALDIDTQNQQIEAYLRFLQPEQRSFHEPWMVENVRERAADQEPSDHSLDTIIDQTIVQVSPNGLSQRVVQVVQRVNDAEGVSDARSESVGFRSGDEYVDVMSVRVHKPDGRVLQDYNEWTSGGSRKGSSYYNDRKYRNIRAQNVEKGDLVEFRYRLQESAGGNFRGDYFGDVSYVQSSRPVGYARYVVEAPETWELYFRAPAHDHTRVTSRPGDAEAPTGFRVQGFEVSDIPAVNTDPDQPGYTDVYDYLMVSNKETWDEIGSWWWELIDEQLITSDPIKQKVDELTEGLESDRAKMEAIHNWVVKNTRYLHLGLGVHGWKPYKTTRAFNNKFGDCKDKSSLLKVMLEAAGIPTQLVLVRTRDLGHVEQRPASMHIFNHAIGYVPQFDLFLDPTAEFNGTTELTPMDQGAQALIVRDGGDAEFVTLPIDEPDANRTETQMTVQLPEPASEGGTATVKGNITAYGQHAVRYRRNLQDGSRRDQDFEKQLVDTYPGATLESATYRNLGDLERPSKVEFSFSGGRFLRGGSSGGYVYPSGVERDLLERYAEKSERHQDLTIRVPFTNQATITYELPEGYVFEEIPEAVRLDSDFGQLRLDYDMSAGGGQGRRLVVDVRYSLSKQRIPVERYGEFRSFVSTMTDELNRTIGVAPAAGAAEGSVSGMAPDNAGGSNDG